MTLPIGLAAVARQHVADIPRLTHAEARELAQTEYERVLSLHWFLNNLEVPY